MNLKILNKIFTMTEQEVLLFMYEFFKNKKYKKINLTKDYLYAQGKIPVLLVAHADTVHLEKPKICINLTTKKVTAPNGLGADDRAGVLAITEILNRGYKPSVLITTSEEIGAKGAHAFCNDFEDLEVKYMIELDRKGKNDAVFYDCDNPNFTKYIESFGFKEEIGSFTDISIIAPHFKVAAVNLSVGYYNQHTKNEYLVLNELEQTIEKVCLMLEDVNNVEKFEYIERRYSFYDSYYKGYPYYDIYIDVDLFTIAEELGYPYEIIEEAFYDIEDKIRRKVDKLVKEEVEKYINGDYLMKYLKKVED